ncbi:AMMECR1 domain-containing protein [Xylariomycetidae sp. FL0641]|nr:AMMECR1 domain-containing protein [Xylariomycetidae sp. FL0641]
MAAVQHCLYCFESLAAHLEGRTPMSLAEVEKSWRAYCADADITAPPSSSSSSSAEKKSLPALRRLAAAASSSSSASASSSPSSGSTMSLDTTETPQTSVSSLPAAAAETETITESPLFVTWNTLSAARGGHASLRGCIGTFEAQDLGEGLRAYALTSALQDQRFAPVGAAELPRLQVAVTLLTDFEDCAGGPLDWALGTHGLRVSFADQGRRYGATYLPDVAPAQGWDREETLLSLMRKAGWTGRRDRWREVDIKAVRYQGKKLELAYDEFRHWRDWVEAQPKGA